MNLSLRFNGKDYGFFTDIEVSRSIENAASTFSFVSTSKTRDNSFPIREGDKVEVMADDGNLVLTGYVDEYSVSYSAGDHKVSIKGRSLTADLIDSAVLGKQTFTGLNFIDLCKIIAKEFKIDIEDLTEGFGESLEINASVKEGESAFEFLRSFARKNQILLTDNEKGNLVITQGGSKVSPYIIKNVVRGLTNNVKSASKTVNLSEIYSEYKFEGQMNVLGLEKETTPKDISNQNGKAVDEDMKRPRLKLIYSKEASTSESLTPQAEWERGIRRAQAFHYECEVQGFIFDGELVWKSNLIYAIVDNFADLDGEYLCKKVTYSYSLNEGSKNKLEFTLKDAYSLKAKKDELKSKSSKSTINFFNDIP